MHVFVGVYTGNTCVRACEGVSGLCLVHDRCLIEFLQTTHDQSNLVSNNALLNMKLYKRI